MDLHCVAFCKFQYLSYDEQGVHPVGQLCSQSPTNRCFSQRDVKWRNCVMEGFHWKVGKRV